MSSLVKLSISIPRNYILSLFFSFFAAIIGSNSKQNQLQLQEWFYYRLIRKTNCSEYILLLNWNICSIDFLFKLIIKKKLIERCGVASIIGSTVSRYSHKTWVSFIGKSWTNNIYFFPFVFWKKQLSKEIGGQKIWGWPFTYKVNSLHTLPHRLNNWCSKYCIL